MLSDILSGPLALAPNALALQLGERTLTYAELNELTGRCAAWLSSQGVGAGDKVAVWLVNSPEWLGLLFGAARIGATIVSVNTRYRAAEVEYLLHKSGAKLLIMQTAFRKIDFSAILADISQDAVPQLQRIALMGGNGNSKPMLGCEVVAFDPHTHVAETADLTTNADRPVILFTTSGTTSGPKLVQHTGRTLSLHSACVATSEGMQPDCTMVLVLPLCGVFGLNPVLAMLSAGGFVVMTDAFDADEVAQLAQQHRATHIYAPDQVFDALAVAIDGPLDSARRFGFAAFQPGLDAFSERMLACGFPVVGLYGSSEVNAVFALQKSNANLPARTQGGGYPVNPLSKIRVRDTQSDALLEPEEVGEIEIHAPTSFIGYLNNPEATSKAMTEDGYFRTGDIGWLRPDGSFVYEGRAGDALRLGGFLVNPAEIEGEVGAIPGVKNVQVVGAEQGGKAIAVAFIISNDTSLTPADVRAGLKSRVAAFKIPAHIWIIDEYPVTDGPNGTKIQRNQLRRMATERIEGGVT